MVLSVILPLFSAATSHGSAGTPHSTQAQLIHYGDRRCPGGSSQECDGERRCGPVQSAFEVMMSAFWSVQKLFVSRQEEQQVARGTETQCYSGIQAMPPAALPLTAQLARWRWPVGAELPHASVVGKKEKHYNRGTVRSGCCFSSGVGHACAVHAGYTQLLRARETSPGHILI